MLSMGGRLRGGVQGNHGQAGEDCEGPNWIGEGGVGDNCSPSLAAFDGDGVLSPRHSSGTAKVRFIFGLIYLLIRKMTYWECRGSARIVYALQRRRALVVTEPRDGEASANTISQRLSWY